MKLQPSASPEINASDPNKKDKRRKSPEAIGSFVVESPKIETADKLPTDDKNESIWNRPIAKAEQPAESLLDTFDAVEALSDTAEAEAAILETLQPEETQYVEREIAKANMAEVTAEPSEEQQAVENFREKIIDEAMASELALAETLAEIGAAAEEPAEASESVADAENNEVVDDEEAESTATSGSGGSGASGQPPHQPPPANGGGSQGGNGNGPGGPSVPNLPPSASPLPNFGPYGAPNLYPNQPPATPNVAAMPVASTEFDRNSQNPNRRRAGEILLGGIVGYLIGRRRGRIKTEKRLLPIQHKLEKQVSALETELFQKEETIRRAVRQKQAHQLSAERFRTVERRAPLEANRLHSATAPEHIGKMVINAEQPQYKAEKRSPKLSPEQTASVNKRVETLSRSELLALSETIVVEGSTLRRVYESQLITERGLRRLVAEHLRGGNLQKALRREIVEHEIDFERDPVMRDHPAAATAAGSATTSLQALLENATKQLPGGAIGDSQAMLKAQAAHDTAASRQTKQHRQMADAALVTIILLLLAAVVYMALTRQ